MNYSHTELASSVIEAAMEVQRTLGGGFSKDVFKRALAAELAHEGVDAEVDAVMPLIYKGDEVGEQRVDISVERAVCVVLEADPDYRLPDMERIVRHLRASGMETGLLINFGPCKLEYVRVHVQGCRSEILIGDSIQHQPERKNPFSKNGHAQTNGALYASHAGRRLPWLPQWARSR